MRIFLGLLIFISFFGEIFAEESYLPESANPKTYKILSSCYSQDDITFFHYGYPMGNMEDWKNMKIFEDGCLAKLGGKLYFAGQDFSYWDNKKNEAVIVIPDDATFHLIKVQSGVVLGVDKDYIFHGNIALKIPKGFDISKMKHLQYEYMTDGNSLYYMGSADGTMLRIEGIDIPSFGVFMSPMGSRFFYDKNGAYNDSFFPSKQRPQDEVHIAYIDVKEMKLYPSYDFNSLTESGVFIFDSKNIYSPRISVKVDIKTFGLFSDGQLAHDKNHIYTPTGKVIFGIDMSDYVYLGRGIIRSRGKLFIGCKPEIDCNGYELTDFDANSFRVYEWGFMDKNGYYNLYLSPINKPELDIIPYTGSVNYYHNSKNVFTHIWGDEYTILTGVVLGNFTTFSGTSYAKDSRFCWFEGTQFSCNPKTFQAIEGWRAKDTKNVYYQDKKIVGADPKSFTGINTGGFNWIETYHYMRDKNRIYYDDHVIRDSDPKTFELMKDLHAKDKNNIYYAGWIIEGADYKTYMPLRWSFALDMNHFYFAGIMLDKIRNPKEVKIIDREKLQYKGKIQ